MLLLIVRAIDDASVFLRGLHPIVVGLLAAIMGIASCISFYAGDTAAAFLTRQLAGGP